MCYLFLAAAVALLFSTAAVADTNAGNSLFVLGDSSVRCGGNSFLFPPFNAAPNSSSFESRSCSRLLHDVIAEKMGLPPVPPMPPFDELNGTADIDTVQFLSNGVNFGSVDGTVLTGLPSSLLFQGLHRQVALVYDTVQTMQLTLGPEKALEITSNAVFWLSFGKDDYVDLIWQDSSRLIPKYGRRGFAAVLVPQIIQAMEDLYNAGARKMVVAGLLPLGCSPWAVFDKKACVKETNNLVKGFNELLSNSIRDLNRRITDASMVFCDVYLGMVEMIVYPRLHGFEDVSNACCGGMKGFAGLIEECLSKEMACETPSRYVWWDVYRPSTSVNELLAKWAWSGGGHWSICRAMPLSRLTNSR